jgi:hypothetical protein
MTCRALTSDRAAVLPTRMVSEVAEADSHVVVQRVRHCHCHAESHDAVGDAESIDVPIAQKEHACDGSPHQGDGRQNWIGQVRQREYDRRHDDGHRLARKQA